MSQSFQATNQSITIHFGGKFEFVPFFKKSIMYSAPPGDEFAPNFFIEDVYDGDEKVDDEQGPKLINGLGVLSDGFYGSNVTLLESGLSSGEYFKLSRLNQQKKFTSSFHRISYSSDSNLC